MNVSGDIKTQRRSIQVSDNAEGEEVGADAAYAHVRLSDNRLPNDA